MGMRRTLCRERVGMWGMSLILNLLITFSVAAQPVDVELRGYAKDLAIRSRTFFTDEPYLLNLSRLRTRGLVHVGRDVHGEVWLDTEGLLGDYLRTAEFQQSQQLERVSPTWFDLSWTVSDDRNHVIRQRLFRAFATAYLDQVRVTVGRQRIAWGTGFVWNPTDLLNPIDPTAIEREEKQGVDAAYVSVPFGTLSQVEAVVAPNDPWTRASMAGRISTNWKGYDVSLMGGSFRDAGVIGGDFAGYIRSAGFRGEWAVTWGDRGDPYLRAVLNADYNFPSDYYVFLEAYYNGHGVTDKEDYNFQQLLSGTTFSLAKAYGAASVQKSITPLLRAQLYGVLNLNDQSGLAAPSLAYSATTNLEVGVSTYLFLGADGTEYGSFSPAAFAYLQYYF